MAAPTNRHALSRPAERDTCHPARRIAYASEVLWKNPGTGMTTQRATADLDPEVEYRAIEATLLESGRGRWFLAEHGRRARRLDSALLDEAIVRLKAALREPPALLGQLRTEIEELKQHLSEAKATLMARPKAPAAGAATHEILKAAEEIHEIAWSLQASPFDPKGCAEVARHASHLYALSQAQAIESERIVAAGAALDAGVSKLEAVLETIANELEVDPARD